MKDYETPILEVVSFSDADVICNSNPACSTGNNETETIFQP